MTQELALFIWQVRIWTNEETKREIKSLAAKEGMNLRDFLSKLVLCGLEKLKEE